MTNYFYLFKKTEIISSIFSKQNGMKLESREKTGKFTKYEN